MRILFGAAIAVLCLLAAPAVAFAADATTAAVASYTVDLTQIVTLALTTIGTILAALAAAWVQKAGKSVGLTIDDKQRSAIETGAQSIANMMIGKIKDGTLKISSKNEAISTFANLLLQHYPDALAYFGLTNDPVKLANLVEARLEKWGVMPAVADADASATSSVGAAPAAPAAAALSPSAVTQSVS